MGSTRLPGKVMKEVLGKTMLEHLILRLRRCGSFRDIVIATTINPEDEKIAQAAEALGVPVFRGSEDDVLDRYYQAAEKFGADVVLRITSDCPLHDPSVVDRVVDFYVKNADRYDYVSNVRPPTYPDGMDVEIFSFATLERMFKEAQLPSEHEHVTAYLGNHMDSFRVGNVMAEKDHHDMRITVDRPEDFELVKNIFGELYPAKSDFGFDNILDLQKRKPEMFLVNQTIVRNEGYKKSILKDKEILS